MARVPITRGLLQTAWTLRDNVSASDALYVVAAQDLGAELVTTDRRVARVVPRLAVELDPSP